MKKDKKHYIVYYNDGQNEVVQTLKNLFRNDIMFIIERTFVKYSSGQKLYSYYANKLLDENKNPIKENAFRWGKIKCTIMEDEFWGKHQDNPKIESVILAIEVIDLVNKMNVLKFPTHHTDPFENIKNDLNLLNRLGTLEGFYAVKQLQSQILKINRKYGRK